MDLPLVSVIVPIYKVESYLCQCVDSIINQTYKNLEIILVDDGSPDNCPSICDEYALNDNRIKVIHKKNGGLSDARNAGMEMATGNYWSFVDSDDVCHKNMIEILMKPMIDNCSLKMSVCRFKTFEKDDDIATSQALTTDYKIVDYTKIFSFCGGVSWAKIYASELFSNIIFPVGRLHEDEFTTYKLVYSSQKIAYTDSQLYFYRQRVGSIMSMRNTKSFIDIHDALIEQLKFYNKYSVNKLYSSVLVSFAKEFALYSQNKNKNNDFVSQWKKELKNCSIDYLSYKQKISFFTYVLFPKIRLYIKKFFF